MILTFYFIYFYEFHPGHQCSSLTQLTLLRTLCIPRKKSTFSPLFSSLMQQCSVGVLSSNLMLCCAFHVFLHNTNEV